MSLGSRNFRISLDVFVARLTLNTLDFLTNYNCRSRKRFLPPPPADHSHMFILAVVPRAGCAHLFTLSCWCSRRACAECQITRTDSFPLSPSVHLLGLGVKYAQVLLLMNFAVEAASIRPAQALAISASPL